MIELKSLSDKEVGLYGTALVHFLEENFPGEIGLNKKYLEKFEKLNLTAISRIRTNRKRVAEDFERIKKLNRIFKVMPIKDENGNLGVAFQTPNENEELQKLAAKLAFNLVDVSTNEKDTPHHEIIDKKLFKFRNPTKSERFVLVTGAGVSHAATKGAMPLSNEAIKGIEKELVEVEGIPKKLLDEELENLENYTGLDVNEFETHLLAYSKFSLSAVKRGLKKMCEIKQIPNLEYETISHMIKHRFIDIAINMNVDLLFDNCLKEELSENDFNPIFSESQCPDEENFDKYFLINNRLRRPIYMKPHGTISQNSSIRFIKDRFTQSSPLIWKTIRKLVDARLNSSPPKSLKVNFIIMGFAMKSPDLLKVIKGYLKDSSIAPHFWFFDKKKNLDEFELPLEPPVKKLIKDNSSFFIIDEKDTLSNYIEILWDKIEKSFVKNYLQRGIERHQLINKIFAPKNAIEAKENSPALLLKYYDDRIYLELILTFLSSDGMINLGHIAEGRIENYLRIRNELSIESEPRNIGYYCKKLDLGIYKEFISDAFVLRPPDEFYSKDLCQKFYKKLLGVISINRKDFLSNNEKDLIDLIKKIKKRNTLKIKPNYVHPHNNLFPNLKEENILNTSLIWIYRYRTALENEDWDLMLAVSEKGRFIPSDEERKKVFKGKKVELVLCSFNIEDFPDIPEDGRFNDIDLLSKEPLYLPWWLHNKHMAILLKKIGTDGKREFDNWEIKVGFYYESRMLSRNVNPVQITSQNDKVELMNIFANYWHRASEYSKQLKNKEKEKSVPIVETKEQLNGYIDEILGKF